MLRRYGTFLGEDYRGVPTKIVNHVGKQLEIRSGDGYVDGREHDVAVGDRPCRVGGPNSRRHGLPIGLLVLGLSKRERSSPRSTTRKDLPARGLEVEVFGARHLDAMHAELDDPRAQRGRIVAA
jgi:hypothetical protein